jgi:hypothetical protein
MSAATMVRYPHCDRTIQRRHIPPPRTGAPKKLYATRESEPENVADIRVCWQSGAKVKPVRRLRQADLESRVDWGVVCEAVPIVLQPIDPVDLGSPHDPE